MFGSDYALIGFGDEVILFSVVLIALLVVIFSYVVTMFQSSSSDSQQHDNQLFEGEIFFLASYVCRLNPEDRIIKKSKDRKFDLGHKI